MTISLSAHTDYCEVHSDTKLFYEMPGTILSFKVDSGSHNAIKS